MEQEAVKGLSELVDERKAATILGVSRGTLRSWRKHQRGPAWLKLEGVVRYDLAVLRAYIEASRSAVKVG